MLIVFLFLFFLVHSINSFPSVICYSILLQVHCAGKEVELILYQSALWYFYMLHGACLFFFMIEYGFAPISAGDKKVPLILHSYVEMHLHQRTWIIFLQPILLQLQVSNQFNHTCVHFSCQNYFSIIIVRKRQLYKWTIRREYISARLLMQFLFYIRSFRYLP